MKNNTLTYRVCQLEKTMARHEEILFGDKGILTNHIPHMQTDISSIKTEVRVLAIINIGALILFKLLS